MHAAYGGKREDGGLFIHTTLLERSGLETGDNGNWNENRSRRTVCFVLYCKSPGVFALLYWLFGLESRAYSEFQALLYHAVFRMTAAWRWKDGSTIIDRDTFHQAGLTRRFVPVNMIDGDVVGLSLIGFYCFSVKSSV